MKRALFALAITVAAVMAAAIGGRSASAAGLCAYPTSTGAGPITASGTTATATFAVVSVPCTVNLISYLSLTGGTRIPVGSVSVTYTTIGPYTLQVPLLCGTDNQLELFLGSPPANADTDIGAFAFTPTCAGGAFTQGYWRNHPSAWPVSTVTVGAGSLTVAQAIAILATPVQGDATLNLAHQLIAAELNVARGAPSSCISATIAAANALLTTNPVGSRLAPSSPAGVTATQLAATLDSYNNGALCAPSGE